MNRELFTKHIDEEGKFYHVIRSSGEVTYDIPNGDVVPLNRPKLDTNSEQNQDLRVAKALARRERAMVTQRIRREHEKNIAKEQVEREREKSRQLDDLWRKSCENAKDSGVVGLNFRDLGYISERIYEFEKEYGIKLRKLALNGNGLSSLQELPLRCRGLQKLSLASNCIKVLEPEVGQMTALIELNLVRNGLERLPDSIGNLKQLEMFDLSNNKLSTLPESFARLEALKVLRLQCNELTTLPEFLGKMSFHEVNVSSNKLSTLPRTIGSVKCLRKLLGSDNRLRSIPIGICSSSIQVLHLSRNDIMELPKAFQNLSTLECLWMDFNKLSALPHGFHRLGRLRELKLDGNRDLVSPPFHVIAKGPTEVLKWCEMRLASSEFSRSRNIILSVLSLLEQVGKHKVCGRCNNDTPHESVYEQSVLFKGDVYFQFDSFSTFFNAFVPKLEKIWSEGGQKGAITSFPYERKEVESTLAEFRDAGGKIVRQRNRALFRQCSCVGKDGKKKVCVPPKPGWLCERPAIMVRSHLVLESTMIEKRRIQNEELRILEAIEASKKVVKLYLSSEEGKETIRIVAEERLQVPGTPGKLTLDTIDDIRRRICSKSDRRDYSRESKSSKPFKWLKFKRKSQDADIEREIREVSTELMKNEINMRRSRAIEVNKKMKNVLDAWLGASVLDVFHEWKRVLYRTKAERQKSKEFEKREQKRLEQENNEQLVLAKKELSLWVRCWDEFNDRPFWQHSLSGEVSAEEPTLANVRNQRLRPIVKAVHDSKVMTLTSANEGRLEKEAFEAAKKVLARRRENLNKTSKSCERQPYLVGNDHEANEKPHKK